jgi:nitroreductase
VIEECLRIAIQAPTGTNAQAWHFVVITDAALRQRIGAIYGEIFRAYRAVGDPMQYAPGDPRSRRRSRNELAEDRLADHMGEVPVLLLACMDRVYREPALSESGYWGSLYPAVWSFMLAARARGLGSAITTTHLERAAEIAALLDLPEHLEQGPLLPVAYYTGDDFRPAVRRPLEEVVSWNRVGAAR